MVKITNFSKEANAYRNAKRFEVDRHFKVRDEFLTLMDEEKNVERKAYLFGQAAVRDTKARELWDTIIFHAEALGTVVSDEDVAKYKREHYPTLGKTPKLSWWKTWLGNFKD
jgi:hypothetical protein